MRDIVPSFRCISDKLNFKGDLELFIGLLNSINTMIKSNDTLMQLSLVSETVNPFIESCLLYLIQKVFSINK